MLILNAGEQDRGEFTCTVFDTTLVVLKFRLDVIASIEDSEDAFQCGYPRQRSRIVGGREVNDPGAYPWMALLWHKVQRRPICGGALLSHRFLVTAPQCLLQSGFDPNDVEVRIGEQNITSTENYEVTMQIAEIIPHPNFDQSTYDSDILLLRLQQPVVYSDYIIPICLPSERRGERFLQAGTRSYVIGWGRTEHSASPSDYSDILRRANLSITDQEQCGSQHTHVVTNNMFCAIGESRGEDSCSGDSGGPLIIEVRSHFKECYVVRIHIIISMDMNCFKTLDIDFHWQMISILSNSFLSCKDEGRNYLVGIVSWGIGCGDINFPGVYTRVNRFTKWILEFIRSDLEPCRGKNLYS
ncbi:Transmembrane protease serine 6 [Holothuria leucospilota]|uniref:Transmembrane protease serine 6 n=1 Tax=Holothuria leucospilota TaxID=206669 RepID=A0A9Q0YCC6_HOLLE|nr:Transmembrane protease serine 6 [Holothuria leucospilota]